MESTKPTATAEGSPPTNKDLIRRLFDAMSRGADEEAAAFLAPDAVNYGSGRAGQAGSAESRAAFWHLPQGREGISGLLVQLGALTVPAPDRGSQDR